jgi:hypothetical protein
MRDPDNAVAETTIYAIASFVTIEVWRCHNGLEVPLTNSMKV